MLFSVDQVVSHHLSHDLWHLGLTLTSIKYKSHHGILRFKFFLCVLLHWNKNEDNTVPSAMPKLINGLLTTFQEDFSTSYIHVDFPSQSPLSWPIWYKKRLEKISDCPLMTCIQGSNNICVICVLVWDWIPHLLSLELAFYLSNCDGLTLSVDGRRNAPEDQSLFCIIK